jgi:hypothetical protein
LRIVTAVVAAGLVLVVARAASAEDPCVADVRQFCSGVRPGGGRIASCLHDNEARLSAACRERRAAAEARFRQHVEELVAACGSDVDRLCSGVKPGGGRLFACLNRQQDDLSSSCRPKIEEFQEGMEKISAIRAACRADAERLCAGALSDAEPLVECLQANRASLSETCGSLDPETALLAAQLVDVVDSLNAEERVQEALQILQSINSVPFLRSQILLQFDTYQGLDGRANADRLIFNPQVVFGSRKEFAFQLKVPVLAVYPYSPDRPAQTGLGAVGTAFAWAFAQSTRVRQFVSIGLQWVSPVDPPVGAAWGVIPTYAISVGLVRALSLTGQVTWVRSFASTGYPELDLLVVEPIVVLNLPGRSFVALDTRLGWNFVDGSFLPAVKGVAGLYLDRRKSLSASAWYQVLLSRKTETSGETETEAFRFGVGMALSYFFDW